VAMVVTTAMRARIPQRRKRPGYLHWCWLVSFHLLSDRLGFKRYRIYDIGSSDL